MSDRDPPRSTLHHVEGAKAGDESAWDRLTAKIAEETRRCVRSRDLPPGWEQDDLTQVIAVEVYRSIDRFDAREEDSFRCWVRTILRQRLTDLWRKARAKKRDGDALPLFGSADSEVPEFCLQDESARRPISLVQAQEAERRVHEVEGNLSERHRAVLRLREVEDLSYDEIARRVGLQNGEAARYLFAYARKRRADFMQSYFDSRCTG